MRHQQQIRIVSGYRVIQLKGIEVSLKSEIFLIILSTTPTQPERERDTGRESK